MGECDCSEEYGPCELHCVVLVQRAGASCRTSDELMLVLCHDLVDCGASLSPCGAEVLARADAYADGCRSEWGTMWFEDDGSTYDQLVSLADQLEVDAEVSVFMEDGYRIVRATADCPLYVDEDADAPAGGDAEVRYPAWTERS
jgi:hypothetical protein